MPRARVRIAIAANPALLAKDRKPWRKFLKKVSITALPCFERRCSRSTTISSQRIGKKERDGSLGWSLFSKTFLRNKMPDLEVLHAIQHHDVVKSGYAGKPGGGPENSGTRSILLQVLRIRWQ